MAQRCITDRPHASDLVRFCEGWGSRFLVTVDTEEEFDWSQPVGRSQHSLTDLGSIAHFQSFCESQGIVPLYLIDYPIATSADAAKILKGAIAEGRAEVGVHLHPWVSPPFEEAIGEFNSFSGNLPERLEHAKFEQLYAAIVHNFGKSPVSYRAGRYGVGPNTTEILRNHHIAIDSSARSYFNYEATGGPNFEGLPVQPWWLDDRRTLMEVPLTAVFSGLLRQLGPSLYPRFSKMPVLRGALSKLGLLERIPLTPEGISESEALRAIELAVRDNLPLLVFSFHSPSLAPGHTPYVRTPADQDAFYNWWRVVIRALEKHGVRPAALSEVMAAAITTP